MMDDGTKNSKPGLRMLRILQMLWDRMGQVKPTNIVVDGCSVPVEGNPGYVWRVCWIKDQVLMARCN